MDTTRWPTLDPEFVAGLEALPDMMDLMDDVVLLRQLMAPAAPAIDPRHSDALEITDETTIGGVAVRVYRPRGLQSQAPGLLYIHGGGFCIGSVDFEHAAAAQMSATLGAVVVNVEYRLAPEHPYPAGLEDCYNALSYLVGLPGVDPTRIAVQGQSAGGGLTAAVVLYARDRGGPSIAFQAMGIPELDDRLDTPSMQAFVDTPMWSRPQAIKSWQYYLGSREADSYAAPARATDLTGLPPAYIATMELDPLRDEGIEYAMRLLAAGVSVELHSYPGTFHGSATFTETAVSKRAHADYMAAMKRGLGITVSEAE